MHANSLKNHISHLEEAHQNLDRKIKAMMESYKDDSVVHEMKKKKLHLKDEIERCRQKLAEMLK